MIHLNFLQTSRLGIRRADARDAAFIHRLWTMPEVMKYVGFPLGLSISVEEIEREIIDSPDSDFGSRLIVTQLETGDQIGQCKIGAADGDGVCEPDIKLLPEYWGRGFGKELWAAMIDYAFLNSSAYIVQGTPNRANAASLRMQLGSGMLKVDEGVFPNHPSPHPGAIPVPYAKLQISRARWMDGQASNKEARHEP